MRTSPKIFGSQPQRIFKTICLEHIAIDPVVTADAARIMRAPETFNHKFDPPEPTSVVSDEIHVYSWIEFKSFFYGDTDELLQRPNERSQESEDILASIPKGIDEDTKAILKLDNFAKSFEVLAQKSVDDEGGCAQIKYICENAAALEEPLWFAGLSIAKFCDDGKTAIHELSNPDPRYNYEDTEDKASRFPAPRTCEWFISNYPADATDVSTEERSQVQFNWARVFKPAPAPNKEDAVWEVPNTQKVPDFPDFMTPFVRGQNGGIYFVPAPKTDKQGKKHQDDPILILAHDLFPLNAW
jgi:hypothetical protein